MPFLRKTPAAGLLAACSLMAGCAAHYPADSLAPVPPVRHPSVVINKTPSRPGSYVVRKGDTLQSIALRFGIDNRVLANWNDIAPPYAVNPGQSIRLFQSKQAIRPEMGRLPDLVSVEKRRPGPQKKPTNSIDNRDVLKLYWQWPLKGSILKNYSGEDNKGIDIAGEAGQVVRAAADGKVVYSGDGLVGYGSLLIIKHNEEYLSAYANNGKLLVSKGVKVDLGQAIAELGSIGSQSYLHFEIRKNGSPVDPTEYLPEK